jgi:hypothetical protein
MKGNIVNRIVLLILLMVCCLLVFAGCKSHKLAMVTPVAKPVATVKPAENTLRNKLTEIRGSQLVFNTFSARANTKLDVNGDSKDVTLNIRIDRDKQIWVSISANILISVEIARAVITPDSIKIVNKLQGLYIKKPFSYIYTYASRQVNYKTLESLLVGNAMPELLNEKASLQTDNNNITLSGTLQDLIYKLMIGPDMKVAQLNLSNQNEGQSLQVTNQAFIQASNKIVPSQINIASVIKDKTLHVNLHYTKVDFDQQLQYPFNIPESYAPAN